MVERLSVGRILTRRHVWPSYLTQNVFKFVSQKSTPPQKIVNLSLTITNRKNELSDLWGT